MDDENGNYDYLMLTDIDVSSPVVYDELLKWSLWYIEIAELDGFRLDVLKHIGFEFFKNLLMT